jgi:hypothetical protein
VSDAQFRASSPPHYVETRRPTVRAHHLDGFHGRLGVSGVPSPVLDALAVVLIVARMLQTVTHVAVEQTSAVGWTDHRHIGVDQFVHC